jgi:hypothetical protein
MPISFLDFLWRKNGRRRRLNHSYILAITGFQGMGLLRHVCGILASMFHGKILDFPNQ